MRILKAASMFSTLAVVTVLTACHSVASNAMPEPERRADSTQTTSAATPIALGNIGNDPGHVGAGSALAPRDGNQLAAFAAGCFWGVEDTFRHAPGVVATAVGYTGGHTTSPTYESVCTHTTAHAETVLVEFNPKLVTYDTLLNVFFKNHNPTTRNRQGPDVGDQYRSEVFTFTPAQDAAAHAAKVREETALGKPVVTRIESLGQFWKAEEYHQQYDEKTGTHSCPLPHGLPQQGT